VHAENTLGAFRNAIQAGYQGIEMDVRLTKDGVPVLHHDAALNPLYTITQDGCLIQAQQPPTIESLNHADLCAYTLQKPQSDQSDHIPSLTEAIELIRSLSRTCLILVEVKAALSVPDDKAWQPTVDAVLAAIARNPPPNPIAVCSFNWHALADINMRCPDIPTWFVTHPLARKGSYWPKMEQLYDLHEVCALNPSGRSQMAQSITLQIGALGGQCWLMHHSDFDSTALDACRSAGLSPAAWAADTLAAEERSRLEALGEGALCLNDL
jgi:glycerophosphoryl diester phosphodiesterase